MDIRINIYRVKDQKGNAVAYDAEIGWNIDECDRVPPQVLRNLSAAMKIIIDKALNSGIESNEKL